MGDFFHVIDPDMRIVLESDPHSVRPSFIRAAAVETLANAENDLIDPEVHNAAQRYELAEEAAPEEDPIKVHALLAKFWSI
jgi:hypothetical protein